MKVISLFDETRIMLEPWKDSFECIAFDLEHKGDKCIDGIRCVHADLTTPSALLPFTKDVYAVSVEGVRRFLAGETAKDPGS